MTTSSSPIPHIQLLCIDEAFASAFEAARVKHKLPATVSITHHSDRLADLPASVKFDTIVSPANSYARLDGAFDDAISRAFSPIAAGNFGTQDYLALTHAAQKVVYDRYRGFAPPGTCTLIPIPAEFDGRNRNVWGTRRVALCPTMRCPTVVKWDREIVYECVWSLLCEVDNHNRRVRQRSSADHKNNDDDSDNEEIRSILMTPLATGVGRVSAERWAAQVVLAMKHFAQACKNPDKWSKLDWADFGVSAAEVQLTWDL
ncbi:uncharacterized protein B0I36DRAFT_2722 [Microdochium trichocladiopsis]|uniref:Macro domain-like protein n=1 Tax=Microdochium trichocladiopsis TaxID=1682393 RepID=A0A9P8YH13_9PEZI|nr:uncharacterized protein B0I36DRAFT_2722 [Microdochium trichocladiopsis]KAH7039833.1 hypothetical protein B0I36DRAFT_2722 [Microdochium trichocladiopsis]